MHLFVAVDRTSKFAFAQLQEAANLKTDATFLKAMIAAVPYKIHIVLTDSGVQSYDMSLMSADCQPNPKRGYPFCYTLPHRPPASRNPSNDAI